MPVILIATTTGFTRSDLAAETALFNIPIEAWRISTTGGPLALATAPPAATDLGVGYLAFATGLLNLNAGDLKTTTSTRVARAQFILPPEYVTAGAITLRINAGMLTTVADTSCTIDAEAYLSNSDTTKTGSDLVTTSAQPMNSLTFAAKDFVISSPTLAAGGILDIRLTMVTVDAATAGVVKPALAHVKMLLEIKG